VGSTREVGEWVRAVYAEPLTLRAKSVAEIENLEPIIGGERDQLNNGAIEIVEAGYQLAARTIVAIGVGRECLTNSLCHAGKISDCGQFGRAACVGL
jgi:hypothetical protein